jgi:ribose transport system substrate-binding protein
MKKFIAAMAISALAFTGCGGSESDTAGNGDTSTEKRIKVAYVTNGIDPFWNIAEAGALAGAKEFNVDCEVLMPPNGLADQQRMIETLLANGIQGVAVSPIDAESQTSFLKKVAGMTNMITQDSDAPGSDRLCFIGMNNYTAGRQAGELIKKALPDGGEIVIFVGRLEQLNAQQRRQGVIDELMDRPVATLETMQVEQNDTPIVGEKFTVLTTLTDGFDRPKAKANAENAMVTYENLDAMVGLFAYNIPSCIEAVKSANRLNDIKLISFDEADGTLQGITDGYVQGTISQQPFEYGRLSVKVMAALVRGEETGIPENKFIEVQSKVVEKENVEEFWTELKKLKGQG